MKPYFLYDGIVELAQTLNGTESKKGVRSIYAIIYTCQEPKELISSIIITT